MIIAERYEFVAAVIIAAGCDVQIILVCEVQHLIFQFLCKAGIIAFHSLQTKTDQTLQTLIHFLTDNNLIPASV